MRTLLQISRGIDAFTDRIGSLANGITLLLVILGFYNVVARYLGRFIGQRLTSNAIIETQWYFFSILFFLGFAYILKNNINVRVDFLYAKWSYRRRAMVDLLGTILLLIPFCLLGIYVSINPVMLSWGRLPDGSWGTWESSPDPEGLPRAPIKSMIIVAFILLLLQALSQVIKYVAVLTGELESTEAAKLEEYHQIAVE